MAAKDAPPDAVVEYKANDVEAVDIRSPAKNRYKGTPLNPDNNGGCKLPILFERKSKKWWNPQFDSSNLEKQYQKIYFPQIKRLFQYALIYIIFACIAWCVFFALMKQKHWIPFLSGTAALLGLCIVVLLYTLSALFEKYQTHTAIVISLLSCIFCLLNFVFVDSDVSAVGTFCGTIEILLLMYTVIPLPLYAALIIGGLYSAIFEALSGFLTDMSQVKYIIPRILMHICIHVVGVHIYFMSQARRRSTFLKVGQSVMTRKDLEVEKQIKQKMINSLMPPQVAQEIMKSREGQVEEEAAPQSQKHGHPSPQRGQITFRTFHMSKLDNVSILFADIVGFTNMSSNKTAEHLVSLLNDLFGRFDILCEKCGCEKISTLGDCYYCVSGCPEPRPDHAQCCIEMGLGMVDAIRAFDQDHNESVNMRVGVHTGTVLCGLVGTRRFKFDVWSNDVTLANMMESEGKPGMVHISEPTYKFVKEDYEVEEGEDVEDISKHKVLIEDYNTSTQQYQVRHVREEETIKTMFIMGRKRVVTVGPLSPSSPKEKTPGADIDNVKIAVDEKVDPQPSTQETSDPPVAPVSPSSGGDSNHVDSQGDANGMSPTVLLGRRETLTVSGAEESVMEKDDSKAERENEAALLNQLQAQRTEQTDNALIATMSEGSFVYEYLHKLPISNLTLKFSKSADEAEFHDHYHSVKVDNSSTFASPRVSAFFDMLVSLIFLVLISICCFVGFPIRLPWIILFSVAIFIEFLMLLPLLIDVCIRGKMASSLHRISNTFASWYLRNIFGAVLASLPVIAVYANFSCNTFDTQAGSDMFYCILIVVSLLHFCNFTMLSSWMKSIIATIAGLVLLTLLGLSVCARTILVVVDDNSTTTAVYDTNDTLAQAGIVGAIFHGEHPLRFEIILNIALLLFLIWFLNREFEISYRLNFHGDIQARAERKKMQQEKEQADWLLHNIIPEHVSDVLKKTSKYCKNHTKVGVIFAKVVNFDDFYDESFEGGREYLRVLNELIGDFEELFDDPKYKDVEKIKTIGSCLMAASGLNPQTRNQNKDPKAHLYALMDFSIDLLAKLDQFNLEIFNFDFEMNIGFNAGEVTAGVIGTTKLLYDIWGDTVNISSRMYSTGVRGRVQVTEDTANLLSDKFEFEYRGKTFVKGKGDMNTYLLVKRKDGATWD